jgi:hypothetical protein
MAINLTTGLTDVRAARECKLAVGTRFYYGGDQCNDSAVGTITKIERDTFGTHLRVTYDNGRKTTLEACSFSPVYLGHGGTRFVTLEAYNTFQRERYRQLNMTWEDEA